MKRFFAGCMAAVFLMASACAGKSESKEESATTASQTTSSIETKETSESSVTTEVPVTSDTSESETTKETADTSDTAAPDVVTAPENGKATLSIYEAPGKDKEIPLEGYTSGTEPVYVHEGRYESTGNVSAEMSKAENDFRNLITDESLWNITKDLKLPPQINGVSATWFSSDESLIEATGKVHRPHDRSRFVILTVIFQDDKGSITCRESLRVTRDMYDKIDPNNIPTMDEYANPEVVANVFPEFKDTEGGWFVFTDEGDLFFFDPDPDSMMVYDQSANRTISYLLGGQISDARVDCEKEAYLCLTTLKKVFYFEDIIDDLVFTGTLDSLGDVVYDYTQYYQGVKVQSAFVRVMSNFDRPYVTININLVRIPDNFSATPEVSEEDVIKDHDLRSCELLIMNDNGFIRLVYIGYRNNAHEQVVIDAKSGKEIASYSTLIT